MSDLVYSTETREGISKIASESKVLAGVDDLDRVTSLKLEKKFKNPPVIGSETPNVGMFTTLTTTTDPVGGNEVGNKDYNNSIYQPKTTGDDLIDIYSDADFHENYLLNEQGLENRFLKRKSICLHNEIYGSTQSINLNFLNTFETLYFPTNDFTVIANVEIPQSETNNSNNKIISERDGAYGWEITKNKLNDFITFYYRGNSETTTFEAVTTNSVRYGCLNTIIARVNRTDRSLSLYLNGIKTDFYIESVLPWTSHGGENFKLGYYLETANKTKYYTCQLFNSLLTESEAFDYLFEKAVPEKYYGANQTLLTSGTLIKGKQYCIDEYISNDSFVNVGASTNASGEVFIATNTTPTIWTNNSILRQTGIILDLKEEGMGELQWRDSSDSGLIGYGNGTKKTCLSNPGNNHIDKYVVKQQTGTQTLNKILNPNYALFLISFEETEGISATINVGTAYLGTDIVNGLVIPVGIKKCVSIDNLTTTETEGQDIYLSGVTSSSKVNITFFSRRLID